MSSVIFATALGNLAPYSASNAFTAARAWSPSSVPQISARAFFAPGCADFGNAARTLPVLWDQQRWVPVAGNTSPRAAQNPNAPSPTASTGARIPRRAAVKAFEALY